MIGNAVLWWKTLALEMGYPASKADAEPHLANANRRAEALVSLFKACYNQLDTKLMLEVGAFAATTSHEFLAGKTTRQAIAFEASPLNYEEFSLANKVDRLEYVHYAVGDGSAKSIAFKVPNDPAYKIWGSVAERKDFDNYTETEVPMTSVDSFLHGRPLQALSVAVWIDVEGLALDVLIGAKMNMSESIALIYVEVEDVHYFSGKGSSYDVLTCLLQNKFIPIARDNEWNGAWNLLAVHEAAFDKLRTLISEWTDNQARLINEC